MQIYPLTATLTWHIHNDNPFGRINLIGYRSADSTGPALAAGKLRLSFLPESRDAFGVVGGHVQLRLHQAFDLEIVFEAGADRRVKQLLCQPQGESGSFGQFGREFFGLAYQLVILDDVIDEAERQSLLSFDKTRGEHQ